MSPIRQALTLFCALLVTTLTLEAKGTHHRRPPVDPPQDRPKVEIALLLDTSNSMDGLINQTREHLWNVVNTFAECESRDGNTRLVVALYEYGNSGLSRNSGYIRCVTPFTTDLDRLSEDLFELRTNGGDEFCGEVIAEALRELPWSKHPDTYQAIFIAGNEPFTQGNVPWNESCRKASNRGIFVNTIFCGHHREGIQTGWKDGALMTRGAYLNIDQNRVSRYIQAPQDERISEISNAINDTYVNYGAHGVQSRRRQALQDSNAMKLNMNAWISRSKAKASSFYDNSSWDLVDALENGTVNLDADVQRSLSEPLQKMDREQLEAHLEEKRSEREALQKEMKQLQKEREAFIAARANEEDDANLGRVMIEAIEKQAATKGLTF